MKLTHVILIFVIASALYVGLKLNSTELIPVAHNDTNTVSRTEIEQKPKNLSGINPDYLMNFLSENGFDIIPVFAGATCDIYTGKLLLSDSNILVQVDVYHERSSSEVLLIETNIDASGYITHPNQLEVE